MLWKSPVYNTWVGGGFPTAVGCCGKVGTFPHRWKHRFVPVLPCLSAVFHSSTYSTTTSNYK